MVACYLNGIGVAAPGIANWQVLQNIMLGDVAYEAEPLSKYTPQSLPANERRRASQLVRLAFRSIEQLTDKLPAAGYATVFCSSGGDYDIFHKICSALALPEKIVSPTQFHNSVHNAPAGYWSIATQNKQPSTTISAYDFSFVMGLVDAACQLQGEAEHILLASYDMVPPEPIASCRPVSADFSSCLLLSSNRTENSFCKLEVQVSDEPEAVTPLNNESLECIRTGNASARSLSLLVAIAQRHVGAILEMDGGRMLRINIEYL